jgi:hypothetical protein
MTNKTEFAEALEFLQSCDITYYDRRTGKEVDGLPEKIIKTLELSLRGMDKLMQEPSDEMLKELGDEKLS